MASDQSLGAAGSLPLRPNGRTTAWLPTAAAIAVFLAYAGFFRAFIETAVTHPYAGHLLFVPLFAAVLLWMERRQLSGLRRTNTPAGAGSLGVALAMLGLGYGVASVPLQAVSFVAALGSLALWSFGVRGLRELRFLLVFLLLMVPPPRAAVAAISPAVQQFVASFSGVALWVLDIPVEQDGIFLRLPAVTLEVAEECSGLRFLPILVVFVAAFARAVLPTTRLQLTLIALSIPVAVLANAVRVAVTSVAAYAVGPQVAIGPTHYYIGKGFWALAFLAMIAIAYVLRTRAHRVFSDRRPRCVVAAGR